MKKSFLMMAVVTALAGAGLTLLSHSSESSLTPTQIANLEALAGPPTGQEGPGSKTCYDDIHSKDGCQVRYCPICEFVPGTADVSGTPKTCGGGNL